MEKTIIVHTGLKPGTPMPYERESLDVPDIELSARGLCSTPEQVLAAVRDAHIGLCMKEPYTREVFAGAPNLKMVIRYGVGFDTIDADAATEFGVIVGYLPDFCTDEVANHAIMMLLACAKKLLQLDHTVRSGGFARAREIMAPMGQIYGETLGLLAFGRIGKATATRAKALDMKVIAYDPYLRPDVFARHGVESVSIEDLATRSDYVSSHLPLTAETRGMADARFFSRMKPTAYFINTSRGSVVNEPDLVNALLQKQIAGAGLDVFREEPLPAGHPFLSMPNVILTPHSAAYADATMVTQKRRVGQDALRVARGGLPDFVANPEVLKKLQNPPAG
jgi:D-3-phosphoglycerate dehydrogenase / 2-oxoglutarate reductase